MIKAAAPPTMTFLYILDSLLIRYAVHSDNASAARFIARNRDDISGREMHRLGHGSHPSRLIWISLRRLCVRSGLLLNCAETRRRRGGANGCRVNADKSVRFLWQNGRPDCFV